MRELKLQEIVETKNLPEVIGHGAMPMVVETNEQRDIDEIIRKKIEGLKAMGFTAAAKKAESAHKMTVAYGQFMFISQETVAKFNDKLRKETLTEDKRARRYKQLMFIPVEKYGKIPPQHVLDALERAKRIGIFDKFEVGKIDWKEETKDPVVFGRIDGCTDYFYIAQWDNDITIEELLSV